MSFYFLAFYNFCILTSVPYWEILPTYAAVHSKKNPHRQSYPRASFKRDEAPVVLSCFSYMDVAIENCFSLSQPHFCCDEALKMVWQIRIPPQETKPTQEGMYTFHATLTYLPPTLQVLKRHKKSCKWNEIPSCLIHFHSQILFLCSSISSHLQLQFCMHRSSTLQYTIIK